ncbi:MAG: hypothetical protein WEG40_16070 [Candidatus Rokuibacteriota bacterium]
MNVALTLLRRLRQLTLREAVKSLVPHKFDVYLYEGTPGTLDATPPVSPRLESTTIERYSAQRLSGVPYIDAKLKGTCEAYAVWIDGEVAHRCFCSWEISHPRQFGFDASAPVLFDGWTRPEHRGKRLHPLVRRHVMEDTLRRGVAKRVYSEITPSNIASLKGNQRSGSRCVARLQGIKFAGLIFRRQVLPPHPSDGPDGVSPGAH